MKIELMDAEETILREIADKVVKRDSVALTYAFCISSLDNTKFSEMNRAIIARWGMSGLDYIKEKAWKIVEGKE